MRGGVPGEIELSRDDFVIVTLGSMTEASSLGSMDSAPVLNGKTSRGRVGLLGEDRRGQTGIWASCCLRRSHRPIQVGVVHNHSAPIHLSFASYVTLPAMYPETGGLITFAKSNWLVSIVLPHQPHFLEQPGDVDVFWGYGLLVDRPGNFVNKPMSVCDGREIMIEILGYLQSESETQRVLSGSICIPCMMPFITSQFLPRIKGDRPQVVPAGWKKLAFIGQFCELADDVVFTIEYSVRSAQTAVYSLLGLQRQPPPVYKEPYDPRILHEAFKALRNTPVESTT